MQKIYLAELRIEEAELDDEKVWRGICKNYVYEGKNILEIRLICEDEGILEILAQEKGPYQEIVGHYECSLSIRQFGTEKCDSDFEDEWKDTIVLTSFNDDLIARVDVQGTPFGLTINTSEDFADFCQNR